MKNTTKLISLISLLFTMLVSSCMKNLPQVTVLASRWDANSNSWVQLQVEDNNVINSKNYIYSQKFTGTANPNKFSTVIGPVDKYDSSKGNMIRVYSFDGKTWSRDSIIGAQTPIKEGECILDEKVNQLYAYYSHTDVPEKEFEFSWELVDPAQYHFFKDKSTTYDNVTFNVKRDVETNKSHNASLTKGMSSPIEGKGRIINAPIPTRRGYKFKGWSVFYPTTALWDMDIDYHPSSTITLNYEDGYVKGNVEEKLVLYAVWDPDYENGYWAIRDNKYVPDMYDRNDYIDDLDKDTVLNFDHYPWYNEVHFPAKGITMPYDTVGSPYTHTHDFALAEHELTGAVLDKIREYNNTLAEGQRFSIPNITAPITQNVTEDYNYLCYGFGKDWSNGGYKKAPYDTLASMSVHQAIVICNAMTSYYNDHNGNGTDLTYAYVDGTGKVIRTITEAIEYLDTIEANGDSFSDLNKTGFRLPTYAEWLFAAMVMPRGLEYERDAHNGTINPNSKFRGSSFPQFQWWFTCSGLAYSKVYKDWDDSSSPSNSNVTKYAFYSTNSKYSSHPYTRGFYSTTNIANGGSINSVAPNYSGVKNMSGNMSELLNTNISKENFYIAGGHIASNATEMRCIYTYSRGKTDNYEYVGMRTCRTITHLK